MLKEDNAHLKPVVICVTVGDTSLSSDVYISDEEDYATQVSLAVSTPLVAGSPVHQRVAPLTTSLHNLPPHIPPRVNDVKMEYVYTSISAPACRRGDLNIDVLHYRKLMSFNLLPLPHF